MRISVGPSATSIVFGEKGAGKTAMRMQMAGRIALSPDIDHELAINSLADEPSAIDALSPREFEILRMLLAEKSVDEIANTLHISVKTAANTRYQIRAKLGVTSDIELVRLALREYAAAREAEKMTEPAR